MCEMFQVISEVVLLIGLFYISWFDYKTKLIERKWLLVMGMLGVTCIFVQGEKDLFVQAFAGMLIGGGMLFLAGISQESIGFGDGWLFVATGVYLGFWKNFVLLFGSLLLAGIFSIFCLVLKKRKKDDRVAMAPFVLASYVVFVL